jgi:serine/threonine protein phosphatase PrpC
MKLQVAGKSHVGMKRKLNEDNYLIRPELGLYLIADGMGGHKAGEVASRMVVDTIEKYWQELAGKTNRSLLESIESNVSDKAKHLMNSISLANTVVHEAQKKPQYHRMGSTISALLVEKKTIWSANVGDSPVFLFKQGRLIIVSEEHSIVAEQKSMGMSDSLSSTSPLIKNMLTRVLGLDEKVDIYITPIGPEEGDMILMCSDGLTNCLSEKAIRSILSNALTSLEDKVEVLVGEANRGGGGDNITVILLKVMEEGRWDKLKKRFMSKGSG